MVAQNKYVDEVYKKAPWVITESKSLKMQNLLRI